MLNDLSSYENLGNPEYFWEVIGLLAREEITWTQSEVDKHFQGKILGGAVVFDGCIELLKRIDIIVVHPGDELTLDSKCATYTRNIKYQKGKIIESTLLKLKDDEVFNEIFSSQNISYDIIYRSIQISNSAFKFKYANFKNLLIELGFLAPHPDAKIKKLIVQPSYKAIFDKQVLTEIKRRKIGIAELEKSLAQKQIYGDEAEKYVLSFEKQRLSAHSLGHQIEIISTYDVSAGYDIVSFTGLASKELDRFIEVKSFNSQAGFYWSRNEIDQAKIKRLNYFLYLVDRLKMGMEDYSPIIIQDPYDTVYLSDDWNKSSTTMYVTMK